MTTFLDGPAEGQNLMLKRSPVFLRVVVGQDGVWDALDQLGDSPRPGETIIAYRIDGEPGTCHLNFGGGKGSWYSVAQYKYVQNQPSEAVMRSHSDWRAWCREAVK